MKSEETIKREMRRLRNLVDKHPDKAVQSAAYSMEAALQWAVAKTDWTPHGEALEAN